MGDDILPQVDQILPAEEARLVHSLTSTITGPLPSHAPVEAAIVLARCILLQPFRTWSQWTRTGYELKRNIGTNTPPALLSDFLDSVDALIESSMDVRAHGIFLLLTCTQSER